MLGRGPSFPDQESDIEPLRIIFGLLGALGVCLLGMKLMSESLQRVAGAGLRDLLGRLTSNRFKGVLTGAAITGLIQSSSATTVMVVSFVAAELMTLTQAIGVIMGANIGTTLTGWVVSFFGFNMKISAIALPAAGLGVCLGFVPSHKWRGWGEALLGFGLLFLGIGLLKDAVPPLEQEQLVFLQRMSQDGLISILIFVGIGTLLTLVLQSSSATMALTLTMAAMGWISYEMAVAMVLGENIGTTATANLAAIGASVEAKRAARVHLLFNLIGVTWAVALMDVYLLPVTDWMVPGDPTVDLLALQGDAAAFAVASGVVTLHLAGMHTLFNVTNTLLMLPWVKQLEWAVTRWVPSAVTKSRLRFLTPTGVEAPELLLIQAGKEMRHMTEVVRSMFVDAMRVLTHQGEWPAALVDATAAREDEIDDLEREISENLTRSTTSATPPPTARKIAEMMENTHRLERIGDHCSVLLRIARRNHETSTSFPPEDLTEIESLAGLVDTAMENLGRYLAGDVRVASLAEDLEQEVDQTRRRLRASQIQRMMQTTEGMPASLAYLDVITHLEEIADRVVGIVRRGEKTRLEIAERSSPGPLGQVIRPAGLSGG